MYSKKQFEEKIKPLLTYIGGISAAIIAILYIVLIIVLIRGFTIDMATSTIVFAIVNAVVGLLILQALKIQGQALAKAIPENEQICKEYYGTKTKDKKLHSMKYFWWTTVIKDIIIKGVSVVISTMCIVYIVVVGSNDWNLLLLAICNLLLFIAFGIISLGKAYDFYNDFHIPYLKEQIRLKKESKDGQEKA